MKRLIGIVLLITACAGDGLCRKFYDDDPLAREPQPRAVQNPSVRKLSDYYDILKHTLATPGEKQSRRTWIPAQGINTLGDPMEGAWWEKRHYWRRMTSAELERGPGGNGAPAMDGRWKVISAKTEGITPGFVARDRNNRQYFVKFDPPSNPEMTTAADQITSKIFYALGYHVPEDYIVYFRSDMLELGEDVCGVRWNHLVKSDYRRVANGIEHIHGLSSLSTDSSPRA